MTRSCILGGADIKPSLISEISRGKLLLGNIPRTLCAVRNPSILNDVCLKRGINFPQTIEAYGTAEVVCEGRWLVKPVYGGSGYGIDFYEGGNLKEGFYLPKVCRRLASFRVLFVGWEGVSLVRVDGAVDRRKKAR